MIFCVCGFSLNWHLQSLQKRVVELQRESSHVFDQSMFKKAAGLLLYHGPFSLCLHAAERVHGPPHPHPQHHDKEEMFEKRMTQHPKRLWFKVLNFASSQRTVLTSFRKCDVASWCVNERRNTFDVAHSYVKRVYLQKRTVSKKHPDVWEGSLPLWESLQSLQHP